MGRRVRGGIPRSRAQALLALLVGWLAAEVGAWCGVSTVDGIPWTPGLGARRRASVSASDPLDRIETTDGSVPAAHPWQAVHPYLGFVVDPASDWGGALGPYGLPAAAEHDRFDPSALRVGIFGGSVAMDLWVRGRAKIARRLQLATGRPVLVDNFALSAYKQPQQLMLLNYALVRGEHFDVVINLDGFNEVALPYDGFEEGLDPTYPFRWDERMRTIPDLEALGALAEARRWHDRRVGLAGALERSPWSLSPLCHLAWRVADRAIAHREGDWRRRWETATAENRSFRDHGLPPPGSEEALFQLETEVWERSSRLMDRIVTASGGVYLHFLQPNQYDEGAKPMGREETALAIGPAGPGTGGWAVRHAYPALSAAGRTLRRDGVRFHDLRRLFADHPEILWADDCCHLNADGAKLLARRVALAVARDLENRSRPATASPAVTGGSG
ncbi:MAG: hypothetical protein R2991_09990 [Thermoanaerobaculia bacterium]